MEYTVVVVTEGNDPPGLAYIAPYAATSIAEHFMEAGRDVLIVYDDLTQHARAYRELSLLLRRPPGREAFPGDIFYIHSRLLERATHLRKELGGGSLTALPIIETEAQNISAYIPTNLISITDGQIYLSPSLFELGVLPAVDVGKSVSRVGGKAQRAAYRAVAGDLKLAYAQFEELETFARFGARLDEDTRKIIEHGRRIRACLKQPEFAPVSVPAQIAVLLALTAKLFDPVPLDQMTDAEHAVHEAAASIPAEVCARFETADKLSDEDRKTIIDIARQALARFPAQAGAEPEPSRARTEAEPQAQGGAARRSHERHHGEPAPKDRQCRRSPIRRPHDEGPGRLEHRTIREVGARAGRLLPDRGAGVGRVLSGERAGGARWRNGTGRADAGAIGAVVFGSDQGLVGQFNEVVADYAIKALAALPGRAQVWAVGERVHARLADAGLPLVGPLRRAELRQGHHPARRADSRGERDAPRPGRSHRAPPLLQPPHVRGGLCARQSATAAAGRRVATRAGRASLADREPARGHGRRHRDLRALIREYLFVSLFRACAESLASENASRLAAMERADKNIDELLETLNGDVPPLAPERHRRGAVRRHLRLRGAGRTAAAPMSICTSAATARKGRPRLRVLSGLVAVRGS